MALPMPRLYKAVQDRIARGVRITPTPTVVFNPDREVMFYNVACCNGVSIQELWISTILTWETCRDFLLYWNYHDDEEAGDEMRPRRILSSEYGDATQYEIARSRTADGLPINSFYMSATRI